MTPLPKTLLFRGAQYQLAAVPHTAGSTTFNTVAEGKTAEEAFTAAVTNARYQHGNGRATGTIAEKVSKLPKPTSQIKFLVIEDHEYLISLFRTQSSAWFARMRKRPAGGYANVSCVTLQNGIILGIVRINRRRDSFFDEGSWVDAPFRRQGLALRMWKKLITEYHPKHIVIAASTIEGHYLTVALKKAYPSIRFTTYDNWLEE